MGSDKARADAEILGIINAASGPVPTARIVSSCEGSRSDVTRAIRMLQADGYVQGIPGRGLALTPRGRELHLRLGLEARVEDLELTVQTLTEQVQLLPMAADPSMTSADLSAAMMDLDPVDRELYDRLRMVRNNLAAAMAISPYQLGQNRAIRMLADMQSRALPRTLDEGEIVGVVPGMTPKTWGRVGQTYLAVMGRWASEQTRLAASGQLLESQVPP